MRSESLLLATTLYLASSKWLTGMEGGTYHCPPGAVLDHKMSEVEGSSGGSPGGVYLLIFKQWNFLQQYILNRQTLRDPSWIVGWKVCPPTQHPLFSKPGESWCSPKSTPRAFIFHGGMRVEMGGWEPKRTRHCCCRTPPFQRLGGASLSADEMWILQASHLH